MLFLSAALKALLQRARTILLNGLDFQAKQKVLKNRFGVLFFYASWKLPKKRGAFDWNTRTNESLKFTNRNKKTVIKTFGKPRLDVGYELGFKFNKKVIY